MGLIAELPVIMEEAEKLYNGLTGKKNGRPGRLILRSGNEPASGNRILLGDNGEIMAKALLREGMRGCCDMIYCDPPFFTGGKRLARIPVSSDRHPEIKALRVDAYEDGAGTTMGTYLAELACRLMLMRDLLSDRGCIFVHLDMRTVHYVKLIMDEIFGAERFVNEIVWAYKSGGAAGKHLSKKHDTILFYSKTGEYCFNVIKEKSYNRDMKPYRFKGVEEFRDSTGWYTMVNQTDVWQVNMVGRSSGERLNYATQKPEALLDRIIKMSTEEGFLCADFYCGSGTLAASAERLGRAFLCVDREPMAVSNTVKRLLHAGASFELESALARGRMPESSLSPGLKKKLRAAREEEMICIRESGKVREKDTLQEPEGILVREDPAALIDYWCIGRMSEGVFEAVKTVFREKNGSLPGKISDEKNCTHVCFVDLRGGMWMKEIKE